MAHGIMKHDKGVVRANSTWHGLKQYECVGDEKISIHKVLEIADYDIEKIQLERPMADETMERVQAWSLVRTDVDVTLVPSVGSKYTVLNNKGMANFIWEHLDGLDIESVGTLFNGATFFMNLKLPDFQVKGDKSPTATNLMYCNPLGAGSYKACAHTTRIVCNNTLKLAEAQGAVNKSLAKFRHTKSATERITEHLIDIAEVHLGIERHKEHMDYLSMRDVNKSQVELFLERLFPEHNADGSKKEGRSHSIAVNSKLQVLKCFEDQRDTFETPTSKYALLNAYTDWIDHYATAKNADRASTTMDGIMGNRAVKKAKALELVEAL